MAESQRLTFVQWAVCVIAVIGFAFDTYELLMLPLMLPPALGELLGAAPGSPPFVLWRGLMFFIPALVGGVFGLLGGYLTDRLGRRRILTWSILLYACSAFAAGYLDEHLDAAVLSLHDVSSACASSSWRRWRGWRSCFPSRSSASACWGTRNSFRRSAGSWWRSSTAWVVSHAAKLAGD